jgi:hypothetical protein
MMMRAIMRRVRWMAVGAGLYWLFDPRDGADRRARIKAKADQQLERFRTTTRPELPSTPVSPDVATAPPSWTAAGVDFHEVG